MKKREKINNPNGAVWDDSPFIIFAKNTDGFCITTTLAAEKRVESDKQTTNFVGLINILGNPIITARIANTPDAIRR